MTSDEATGDARGVTNSPHVASGCRCGIRYRVGCRCSAFSPPSCTRCVECSLAQFSPFSLYYKVSCFTYGFHSDFHTHACSDLRSGGRPKVTVCCGRRRAFHTFRFHCEFHTLCENETRFCFHSEITNPDGARGRQGARSPRSGHKALSGQRGARGRERASVSRDLRIPQTKPPRKTINSHFKRSSL